MSRVDLTGQTFNRLTVLRLSDKKRGTTYLWECRCSCGNKEPVYAMTYQLTHNKKKSCGCAHTKQRSALGRSKRKHYVGEVLGHYILLQDTGKRIDNKVVWLCECLLCGRRKEIVSYNMRHNGQDMPLCDCEETHSRGEDKIIRLFNDNNIYYQREYSFDDLRSNGKKLRFDFRLKDGTLIEYDGIQHYQIKNTGFGEDTNEIVKRDMLKNEYCHKKGIILIRIPYTHYEDLCLQDLLPDTSTFIVKEV